MIDDETANESTGQPEVDETGQAGSPESPPPPPPPPPSQDLPEPPPPPPGTAVGGLAQTQKSVDERKALLANTLQGQVAGGARIESQGDFQAVVVKGHRTNHLLHFLVGVFTLGLWWIVWFFIAIFGGEKRQMITVDEFGNTFVQKV